MLMSDGRETNKNRDKRQLKERRDFEDSQKRENAVAEETYNNTGMMRDIQARQCEVLETLGELKVTIKNIDEHTTVMNEELGHCKEDIAAAKLDIKDLKNKPILKLGWKDLAKITGSMGTIVTIVITVLKFVFHM